MVNELVGDRPPTERRSCARALIPDRIAPSKLKLKLIIISLKLFQLPKRIYYHEVQSHPPGGRGGRLHSKLSSLAGVPLSQGDTAEEALENIKEVIVGCLESLAEKSMRLIGTQGRVIEVTV